MTLPDQEAAPTVAERRAARRANQTAFNLVLALLASLGIVLFLVVVVVRPEMEPRTVDFGEIGAAAQASVDEPLAVPDLPAEWTANRAELVANPADGVTRWEIGFLTPEGQYIGLVQGVDANDSWLADQVRSARSGGTEHIGGLTWNSYDRRDVADPGNIEYALATTSGASTIVLGGTASEEEFAVLAAAVAEGLE
ncbi:DUF4245 domain-containing protein [Pseudolysinimonas sp.]|uniref:DUF4245 domain-containing protein n=1 Tax=Pseudolysinimonas sp. TaxID=2680009 RepID=UPI00286B8B90|nr:DUF4245 domain-containing protein [Pseudolysinimonas sp.]